MLSFVLIFYFKSDAPGLIPKRYSGVFHGLRLIL